MITVTDELIEKVAKAIDDADVGYSINLTSLIDGVSEYTLTYADAEPMKFEEYWQASEHVAERRYREKALAAIWVVLAANPTISGKTA